MAADTIRRAFDEVLQRFPIAGYIEDGGEGECAIAEELIREVPGGGRLLDIGAGPLVKAALFARLGFQCFACDDYQDPWHRREGRLDQLKAFARDSGITLHVHRDGDYSIPFEPASFDVVTVCEVIEHLHESPRDILNAAGGMLKTGGLLVITMPNAVNLKKRIKVLAGRSNHVNALAFFRSSGQWRGHVREYTLTETIAIVRAAGFDVVRARTFDRAAMKKIPSRAGLAIYQVLSAIVPTFRDSLFVAARKPEGWKPAVYSEDDYRQALGDSVPAAVR